MIGDIRIITYGCHEWLVGRGFVEGPALVFLTEASRMPPPPTIVEIQERTADHFRIPMREMTSARRYREVARPRQVAMYLAKELTPRSYPEIGRKFGGRDHTTVMHAVRQITKLRAEDDKLDGDVRCLIRELTH